MRGTYLLVAFFLSVTCVNTFLSFPHGFSLVALRDLRSSEAFTNHFHTWNWMKLMSSDTWCRQNGIYYCTPSLQYSKTSALQIAGNAYTNIPFIRNTWTHAPNVDSDSCPWLTEVELDVGFCCCSSRFYSMCGVSCFSAHHGRKEELFQSP